MKKVTRCICTVLVAIACSVSTGMADQKILKMSTTTSTQASGLLDLLLPELEKDTGIKMKVIAKGTGAAIRDGMDGNVDVIFVHAKAREDDFVAKGYGTKRFAVMHNDFVILGPKSDPAGVKQLDSVVAALEAIASSGSSFVSRGDDSGTHTKEQNLWKATTLQMEETSQTITKKGKKKEVTSVRPQNSQNWYNSIGQGMGKTLTFADEKQVYTMSDRGTYIKYKYGKTPPLGLDVLSEGDAKLANPYGVIPVNPAKHPHVNAELAQQFATWITSEKAQKLIAGYRLEGKQLFYPDAM